MKRSLEFTESNCEEDEATSIVKKQRKNLLKILAETQTCIVDLELSYLDKESNLGIVLRGWPEGSEKLEANENDSSVQKLFSQGNRDIDNNDESKEAQSKPDSNISE